MIELLGAKVVARAAARHRALGLDDATFARARRVLVKRLQGGVPVTRPAVYDALDRAKISTAGQRGIHILWRLAQDCLLCFGPREGKQHTFVLFDEWLPGSKRLPREEALAELSARYFAGHGPATLADFAWWSGLKLADARLGVHLAAQRLREETIDGHAHWVARSAAFSSPSRYRLPAAPSHAHLLPAFDEFLVGYTDRSAVVEPARMIHVNAGGGILNPTIVVDGRVVGTWKRRLARRKVVFLPALFGGLTEAKAQAVTAALRRYAAFLGVELAPAGQGALMRGRDGLRDEAGDRRGLEDRVGAGNRRARAHRT
jgi:hypothetical protein